MIKKLFSVFCAISVICALFTSCHNDTEKTAEEKSTQSENTASMDFVFTDNDLDSSYDEKSAEKIDISKTQLISKAGTYILSGTLTDKELTVEADKEDKIQLVFNNISISNSKGPAINIKSAEKVFITLAENSKNTVSDGSSYTLTEDQTTVDSAIFSREDLTINGNGTLTVKGNYKHGITSKDELIIADGNINITSESVGILGKDCVKFASPVIKINSGTDAVRGENTEDASLGFVYIQNGSYDITAGHDAIQSSSVIKISDGKITAETGGGSKSSSAKSDGSFNEHPSFGQTKESDTSSDSAKGLKAEKDVIIEKGTFSIDSVDDCINSNSSVTISGGTLEMSSGDDGIHADGSLTVSGGKVNLSKSYEGIEANDINISGGTVSVTASDDGFNAAGGNDSSAMDGHPDEGNFEGSDASVNISGGYVFIDAGGDGIDSNGLINVSDGVTLIAGPENGGNSSFDYASGATVTGGVLIALGSIGMAQNFSQAENQGAILYSFPSQQYAQTSFALCDEKDNVIVSFTPKKTYSCAIVTAPEIKEGESYKIVTGATVKNADSNGFAHNSTKIGGTEHATINMTSSLYTSPSGMMGGPGGGMGGQRPDDGRQPDGNLPQPPQGSPGGRQNF